MAKKTTKKAKMTPSQAKAIKNQRYSYGVLFIRAKAINTDSNGNEVGNPGETYAESTRKFGSPDEANHHGKRFTRIEKHVAYHVTYSKSRPNAWVNWKTGKTNPVIGRGRTNRR